MSNKPIQNNTASQLLSSAALSHSLTIGAARSVEQSVELLEVTLKFSSAVTQTLTITRQSVAGANWAPVILTASLSSATSYQYKPSPADPLIRGDILTVACTNSGSPAVTVYSEIRYREAA